MKRLTKTAATAEARQHLRYGYHQLRASAVYVFCPRCRTKVTAEHLPWEPHGPALLSALVTHLLEDHQPEKENA